MYGYRYEPSGRQIQLRRGRREAGAPGHREEQRHQAGGLRPVWRHQRVSGERKGDPDQDGPGRKARRGRTPAREKGIPLDREDTLLHPRCIPHLPSASPRHLLHRGPGAAHLRPEERQQEGPDRGKACVRGGCRHHRLRRGQGGRPGGAHLRLRRRDRSRAPELYPSRGASLGAGPC